LLTMKAFTRLSMGSPVQPRLEKKSTRRPEEKKVSAMSRIKGISTGKACRAPSLHESSGKTLDTKPAAAFGEKIKKCYEPT